MRMSRVSPHETPDIAISGRAVAVVSGFALAIAGVEAPVPTGVGLGAVVLGGILAVGAVLRPSSPEQPR